MPMEIGETHLQLLGYCTVEEAESLFEWLHKHPAGDADLKALEHPHAAVLQALMASPVKISAPPADSFSAACVRQACLPGDPERAT